MLFTMNLWESFICFFWTSVLFLYVNKFVIYIVGILLSSKSENKAKHMLLCTSCSSQYNGVKLKILSDVSEGEDVSTCVAVLGTCSPAMNWLPVSCLWSSCPKERSSTPCTHSPPKCSCLSWNGFKSSFHLKGEQICVFFCSSSTWEVVR